MNIKEQIQESAANMEYEIAKKCVAIRKELGLTQKDISDKTGLTQQQVSSIERMGNTPTLETFLLYLSGMGLEMALEKK